MQKIIVLVMLMVGNIIFSQCKEVDVPVRSYWEKENGKLYKVTVYQTKTVCPEIQKTVVITDNRYYPQVQPVRRRWWGARNYGNDFSNPVNASLAFGGGVPMGTQYFHGVPNDIWGQAIHIVRSTRYRR